MGKLLIPKYQKLNYRELFNIISKKIIKIMEAEAKHVKMKARAQSSSRLWFRMRAGRISASCFKSDCHTNLAQPSISLVMTICHPEMAKFSSLATSWSCEHEKLAMSKYSSLNMRGHHKLFVIGERAKRADTIRGGQIRAGAVRIYILEKKHLKM